MSKATEIYYTECCALCRHFEEGMWAVCILFAESVFCRKKMFGRMNTAVNLN